METVLAPVTSEISAENIAACLNQQYNNVCVKTRDLVRETIHFGAMFAQAEAELQRRGILNDRKSGQGMQSWLSKNCPDINYKTAMRWKMIAVAASRQLSCSSPDALRLLTGEVVDVEHSVVVKRDEIFSAPSLRRLTQQLFDFASEGHAAAGRPAGSTSATPTHLSQVESARRLWARPISIISANRQAFYSSAKLLPLDDARESLCELKELCSALKARVDAK